MKITLIAVGKLKERYFEDAVGEWAEEFMRGYRDASERCGAMLIGGDTTISESGITISVTAIGRCADGNIKRRSDARVGDIVFVNGMLGASAAGLKDILSGHTDTANARVHRNPVPQTEQGLWLGGQPCVHAMMDISDGVASDLLHIMKASGVGASVDTERIPTEVSVEDPDRGVGRGGRVRRRGLQTAVYGRSFVCGGSRAPLPRAFW